MTQARFYEGFSSRMRLVIVISAVILASASLFASWALANKVVGTLPNSEKDTDLILRVSSGLSDPVIRSNDYTLRTHALNVHAHIKAITNKQAHLVLAVGTSFALMAIGFALFLIGADGAFKVQGETPNTKFLLSSSAPGALCFAIAGAVILVAITRSHELNLGKAPYSAVASGTKDAKPAAAAFRRGHDAGRFNAIERPTPIPCC